MNVTYKDKDYEVATNLRVALDLQKEFNHKPYMEIFSGLQSSSLEDQIKIIFVALRVKNPNFATYKDFSDEVLENWGLQKIMLCIQGVVEGITTNGMSPEEKVAFEAEQSKNVKTLP